MPPIFPITTPKLAPKIHGVDLAELTNPQKDDLARLIATRGVVFFRSQKDFDIDAQRPLGEYYGKLHKHATTLVPCREDLDNVHVVYTDQNSREQRANFAPTFLWHSDALQGGDALWSSQYAIYDLLSQGMQKYLEGLEALHSARIQADGSNALGRTVRRELVVTKHPLIRTNPVTGWKSVFFNPGFVTAIVGVSKAESNTVINYLNELTSTTQENHIPFQWQKNDVAFWDNRDCNHSASYGFAPHRRHAVHVASTAERQVFDLAGKS